MRGPRRRAADAGPLTDAVPSNPPGRLSLRDRWTRVIDRDALVDRLRAGDVSLVVARATERYVQALLFVESAVAENGEREGSGGHLQPA